MEEIFAKGITIAIAVVALMIAIIGHEIMHGKVAYKYGDDTAKNAGRFSINPIVHIDLFGTIILPAILILSGSGILFGWAKPVPVNMSTVVRNGGHNAAIHVSLAGIIYNFLLATFVIAVMLVLVKAEVLTTGIFSELLVKFLGSLFMINIVLGVFNLFPIPPLDGSKVVLHLAMKKGYYKVSNFIYKYENYGMIILLGIMFLAPDIIFVPIQYILGFIYGIIF
ncbi:MAG: FIG004556: membrane metalloprotease [uncultured Campylobacterales bacterium]|uniref:FIG004556: membrane metalloprotease n=1 Tax=uncultured Campylobacterales bacterium TaxID=352960 RepID=A0A6S6T1Z2_9BACT|nr:MAG: FIG004556: membrane metalloprotease [uncultured Campylobacterales bacterium]